MDFRKAAGGSSPRSTNTNTNTKAPVAAPCPALTSDLSDVDFRNFNFQPLQPLAELTKDAYFGPIPESNWVIPGVLLAGAFPASNDDHETFQLLSEILKLGVSKFVCLLDEYRANGVTETMWREGAALRPYFHDVEKIVANKSNSATFQGHKICELSQLSFVHFPIKDLGIADDPEVLKLCRKLVKAISEGEVVYVHCWGGHGRTGTIVSIMLHLMYNLDAEEAMRRCQTVHDIRRNSFKVASPQSQIQRDQVSRVINELARQLIEEKDRFTWTWAGDPRYLEDMVRYLNRFIRKEDKKDLCCYRHSKYDYTPIQIAARGNIAALRLLHSFGGDLYGSGGTYKRTALMYSADHDTTGACAQYILNDMAINLSKQDAQIYLRKYNDRNRTALQIAYRYENVMVQNLIREFIKRNPYEYRNSLTSQEKDKFIEKSWDPDQIEFLVEKLNKDMNPNYLHSHWKIGAMHRAAQGEARIERTNVLGLLLSRGADIDLRDNGAYGWTPLMHSAYFDFSGDCAEFFLEHGCDPSLTDRYGRTAMDLCKRVHNKRVESLLAPYNLHDDSPEISQSYEILKIAPSSKPFLENFRKAYESFINEISENLGLDDKYLLILSQLMFNIDHLLLALRKTGGTKLDGVEINNALYFWLKIILTRVSKNDQLLAKLSKIKRIVLNLSWGSEDFIKFTEIVTYLRSLLGAFVSRIELQRKGKREKLIEELKIFDTCRVANYDFPPYYILSREKYVGSPLFREEGFSHRLIFYCDYTKKNAICGFDGMGFRLNLPSERENISEDLYEVGLFVGSTVLGLITPAPALTFLAFTKLAAQVLDRNGTGASGGGGIQNPSRAASEKEKEAKKKEIALLKSQLPSGWEAYCGLTLTTNRLLHERRWLWADSVVITTYKNLRDLYSVELMTSRDRINNLLAHHRSSLYDLSYLNSTSIPSSSISGIRNSESNNNDSSYSNNYTNKNDSSNRSNSNNSSRSNKNTPVSVNDSRNSNRSGGGRGISRPSTIGSQCDDDSPSSSPLSGQTDLYMF